MNKFLPLARRIALGGIALTVALTAGAQPAAPVQQNVSQVPGYYRQPVGEFMVTAVYDGFVDLDTTLLKGMRAEDMQKLFARMFVQHENGVQTAVNAFLVQGKGRLVLVDAGAAACFGPTMGSLMMNIRAAGFAPEEVDDVLLTHLHPDHACGLATKDGKRAFPNAAVWAAKADADHWLSNDAMAKAPEDKKPFFTLAQAAIAPYLEQGAFHTYANDSDLFPGFSVVPTPGHTPGHSSYLLQSKGQALLIWGDIVHSYAVQLPHPDISIEFDTDQKQAIQTRKTVLDSVSKQGWFVAGAHLPFPGLGHIREEEQGYSWVPVEYSPVRID